MSILNNNLNNCTLNNWRAYVIDAATLTNWKALVTSCDGWVVQHDTELMLVVDDWYNTEQEALDKVKELNDSLEPVTIYTYEERYVQDTGVTN